MKRKPKTNKTKDDRSYLMNEQQIAEYLPVGWNVSGSYLFHLSSFLKPVLANKACSLIVRQGPSVLCTSLARSSLGFAIDTWDYFRTKTDCPLAFSPSKCHFQKIHALTLIFISPFQLVAR